MSTSCRVFNKHCKFLDESNVSSNLGRGLFSDARAEALNELYKAKELSRVRPESIEADFEEVAASCGHFSFSLQQFTHEMQNYLAILEDLKEEVEISRSRSWDWLRFWRKSQSSTKMIADPEQIGLMSQDGSHAIPRARHDMERERRKSQEFRVALREHPSRTGLYRFLRLLSVIERDDSKLWFACFRCL